MGGNGYKGEEEGLREGYDAVGILKIGWQLDKST
jgi:hypothetical protein